MKKINIPSAVKKPRIQYTHTSDETVSVHASSYLPRPKEINPLAHQTVNKAIEVSKRSNDLLGTKPKKPNTMLMIAIMVIAIAVVAYIIYQQQAKDVTAPQTPTTSGAKGTAPSTQTENSNKPPKPSDIMPIPIPGLG